MHRTIAAHLIVALAAFASSMAYATTPEGGDVDFYFDPAPINDYVHCVAVLPEGKVLIGGNFTSVGGAARGRIARLNPDGSIDLTFGYGLAGVKGPNDVVLTVAVQPDGRVLIGGRFNFVNGESRNNLARLNADGSLDTTFLNGLAGPNGGVYSIAIQPDGRVLVGGDFSTVNGVSRNKVARLNAGGSIDTTFQDALVNGIVHSIAVQPDGRMLIGGAFTLVDLVSRNRVARLNADGSLDTTFLNGLTGASFNVYSVAVQPDGRVLIGGDFSTVNGVSRDNVARLNADGALDTTFLNGVSGASDPVETVAIQPDGKVLIGGGSGAVNGALRGHIARLNADGALDTTFLKGLAGANGTVHSLAVQSDDGVLIGGSFTIFNGVLRNRVARLYGSVPVAPSITVEPSDDVSYNGCCTGFHAAATGTPQNYQWRKDDVDLVDGGNVSGATSDTLRLIGLTPADEGKYSVAVSNVVGSDTSVVAVLTVVPSPQCKVATCGPFLGCVLVDDAHGTPCNDANACTSTDVCQSGACVGAPGAVPNDVSSVLATKSGVAATFGWAAVSGANAYDVLRGAVRDWPVGSNPATETCFGDVPVTIASDATVPSAGAGYWYLVRAESACGNGGYGSEASHGVPTAPRLSGTCP